MSSLAPVYWVIGTIAVRGISLAALAVRLRWRQRHQEMCPMPLADDRRCARVWRWTSYVRSPREGMLRNDVGTGPGSG